MDQITFKLHHLFVLDGNLWGKSTMHPTYIVISCCHVCLCWLYGHLQILILPVHLTPCGGNRESCALLQTRSGAEPVILPEWSSEQRQDGSSHCLWGTRLQSDRLELHFLQQAARWQATIWLLTSLRKEMIIQKNTMTTEPSSTLHSTCKSKITAEIHFHLLTETLSVAVLGNIHSMDVGLLS